jgi:small subunit ribosomal protein S1
VEGLLHVSEIGFARIQHPKDALALGQTVTVEIRAIERAQDPGRPDKISLSLKSLAPDPWQDCQERFPEGARFPGTVARVEPFGAFVELAPGVEGLVHVSELASAGAGTSARSAFAPGQKVMVTILSVDPARRRIGLALAPDEAGGEDAPHGFAEPARFGTLGDLLRGRTKPKKKR